MIHDYNHAIHASPDGLWSNRLRSATKSEKNRHNKELGVNDLKSPLFTPIKGFMEKNYETFGTPSTNEKIGYKTLLEFNTPSPFHDSIRRQHREVKRLVDRAEMQNLLKLAPQFDQPPDEKSSIQHSPPTRPFTHSTLNPTETHPLLPHSYPPPHHPKYYSNHSRTTLATNPTSNLPKINPNYNYCVNEGSISPRCLSFNKTDPSNNEPHHNYITPQKIIFYNLNNDSVNSTYARGSSAEDMRSRPRTSSFGLGKGEDSYCLNEHIIFNSGEGPRIFSGVCEDGVVEEIYYRGDGEDKGKILLLNSILSKEWEGKGVVRRGAGGGNGSESLGQGPLGKDSEKLTGAESDLGFDLGGSPEKGKVSASGQQDPPITDFGQPDKEKPTNPCGTCNCKNSKCLKLYCECFRQGKMCGPECSCKNCQNTTDFDDLR
jgi:hypothetical protein